MFRNGWKCATAAAALAIGAGWVVPAHATTGYFENGIDAEGKGEAGIGVSSSTGVMAAAYNPALGAKVGNSAGACLSLFMPHRDSTMSADAAAGDLQAGKFTSGMELFEVPCLGANFKTDDVSAVSFLLYASGGMNTNYGSNPFGGANFGLANPSTPAGVDLEQVFLQPSYAREVGHGVTLGGGPLFAAQRFMAQGLTAFDNANRSSAPGFVTNNGYDYSYGGGFKLGVIYDPVEWATLGVSYQTRTWMTPFRKYSGLFAESGDFDIPPAVTSGVTLRPIKTLGVSLEHEHIFYSDVKSIANPGVSLSGTLLGTTNGAGFGWEDMDVFRIGAEWQAMDQLKLRAGYSHNSDFTKGNNAMFNILAPATPTDHASIGATYDITPAWDVTVGYTHAFSNTLNGWNQNDSTQTIKLRMDQDDVAVGFKYKW